MNSCRATWHLTIGICCFAFLGNAANAQGSVTLYGILDTGVEYINHANAQGDSVVRMPSTTGTEGSRWGLRGVEPLGDGVSAVFTLESGFNMKDGTSGQGGRFFGRQAWLGIKSRYGQIALGRQYAMTHWLGIDYETMGSAIYGLGSIDAYLGATRTDNAVTYMGTFDVTRSSKVTVGAAYSFGRDTSGGPPGEGTCVGGTQMTQCQQWSVMAMYKAQWYGVGVSYDQARGGPGASASFFNGVAPFPLSSPSDKSARTVINGYIKYKQFKFSAGFLGRSVTTNGTGPSVRQNLYFIAGQWYVQPDFVLTGEVYRVINHQQDARATAEVAMATYLLSKSTGIYLQAGHLSNSAHAAYTISSGGSSNPGRGMGQVAAMLGMWHRF